jgi:energy-coupling factor transport system permease protein
MTRYHSFPHYHPAAVFLYIAAAIVCAMVTMQTAYLILSFAIGTVYALYLGGARRYFRGLRPMLVMFVLIAVINPLTNHRGAMPLFMLGDNPVTVEALAYGVSAGAMLMAVLIWFQCYQRLITNDKFMFLFGRAAPTSAMIISMILKFVPVTSVKMREIANAQLALGYGGDAAAGSRKIKIRNGVRISGILVSRCMEDSIESAESMRARGYGSGPRTMFARYKLRAEDVVTIVILAALFAANMASIIFIGGKFNFFPRIYGFSAYPLPYVLYAVMLLWPLLVELKERAAARWRG